LSSNAFRAARLSVRISPVLPAAVRIRAARLQAVCKPSSPIAMPKQPFGQLFTAEQQPAPAPRPRSWPNAHPRGGLKCSQGFLDQESPLHRGIQGRVQGPVGLVYGRRGRVTRQGIEA